eukprot:c43305_g1_i1 orf=81-341(+)
MQRWLLVIFETVESSNCNCGPCRRSQGFEATGSLPHTAHVAGFTNIHDYLIHLKTKESQDKISRRKEGRGWCKTSALNLLQNTKTS